MYRISPTNHISSLQSCFDFVITPRNWVWKKFWEHESVKNKKMQVFDRFLANSCDKFHAMVNNQFRKKN